MAITTRGRLVQGDAKAAGCITIASLTRRTPESGSTISGTGKALYVVKTKATSMRASGNAETKVAKARRSHLTGSTTGAG